MTERGPYRAWWWRLDVAVPLALLAAALVPLWPAYATAGFVVATIAAVVLGAAVGTLGAWRGWSALAMAGATLLAFVAVSGLAAPRLALLGVLPTPASVLATGRGLVTAWKEAITIAAPLGEAEPLLTVPVTLALVGAMLATTLSLRLRGAGWALLVPGIVGVIAILFGTLTPVQAIPVALLAAVAGLAWTSWRAGRLELRRPVALTIVGAVAAAGGVAAGGLGPTAHRVVLREVIEPPLDVQAYPSPLAGFRAYLKDHRDDVLFTVENLPPGVPLRLATMDAYDGTAWMVSAGHSGDGGEFRRVGHRIEAGDSADAIDIAVTVEDYAGEWLPGAGEILNVDFAGPRAQDHERNFYFNRVSQTGIVTTGLRQGDAFTLRSLPPRPPTDSALRGAPVAAINQAELTNVPDSLTIAASDFIADASSPAARAQALVGGLIEGYFSHGLEGEAPSLAGHGAARLGELLSADVMIGDEEQYAAAMAIMARSVGLPSRVVMGFAPPERPGTSVEITGDDVTAWVEIAFADHGWVPFYPTPDEDRIPQVEEPDPRDRPQPQVLQPPPPAPEPPDPPPTDRDEVSAEEDELEEEEPLGGMALVALIAGGSLLLFLAPPLAIIGYKLWRRRRRRRRGAPALRSAAAWREVEDHLRDLAIAAPKSATRNEQARHMVTALPARTPERDVGIITLAQRSDAVVFGPDTPTDDHAHEQWRLARATTTALRSVVGRRRWLRSRVSTRSLRKGR